MVSTVVILAALSGIAAMALVNGGTNGTNTTTNVADTFTGQYLPGPRSVFGQRGFECGRGVSITVSQEFKDNVINIAENDSDVQKLLADGYNITAVRPIISATVQADGTVTMKATTAIVTLTQNTTSRATVWVNIEQAKVTRIQVLTMNVIEKP